MELQKSRLHQLTPTPLARSAFRSGNRIFFCLSFFCRPPFSRSPGLRLIFQVRRHEFEESELGELVAQRVGRWFIQSCRDFFGEHSRKHFSRSA